MAVAPRPGSGRLLLLPAGRPKVVAGLYEKRPTRPPAQADDAGPF